MVNNLALLKSFTNWVLGSAVPGQGQNGIDGEVGLTPKSGGCGEVPVLVIHKGRCWYGCLRSCEYRVVTTIITATA